jgi:hypothetical protein
MNGVSGRAYTASVPMRGIMNPDADADEGTTLPWLNMNTAIAAAVMISAFMRR